MGEERNVMVCRSHLSYIIIEKQSDMERRHGSPRIVTSHSFLLTTLQSSLSPSPMRSFGERVMLWLGGKKRKKEKEISGCSAICPEKNACGWYVASKSPSITPFKRIHSCSGGRETHLQKLMSHCRGYEVDLKRGGSLFSPTQLLRGVKTVNWWVVCLSAMSGGDGEEEEEEIITQNCLCCFADPPLSPPLPIVKKV